MPAPSSIRRLSPLRLLLIGLAALAVLVLIPWVAYAQDTTPTNQAATGRPRILVSADGVGFLFADTSRIADGNGLQYLNEQGGRGSPDSGSGAPYNSFSYQWIRVDGETEANIGGDSPRYQLVDADIGNRIKVQVSFEDEDGFDESVTSLTFGPVLRPGRSPRASLTLVSNTGQSASNTTTLTAEYRMAFRLGTHGQGYEISGVSIELAAVPSDLTVSVWIAGVPGLPHADSRRYKLFDFENPDSFVVGLNNFTAPIGAFVYQNVNHYIVLSGFGSSLSIKETTSDAEDAGGEAGAILFDDASSDGVGVLRMAVKGSRRDRGILAANYAQPHSNQQEIISAGDSWGWRLGVGAADRYLIRGFSIYGDDTTTSGGGFTNPYDLWDGDTKLFRLHNSRDVAGISVWTAPGGATVAGGGTYDFVQDGIATDNRWSAVLLRAFAPDNSVEADADAMPPVMAEPPLEDTPTAPGVTLSLEPGGDVALPGGDAGAPFMAFLGEPLDAMVQNLGQTDNSYASVGATNLKVLSQGFTTGSDEFGYRLQGIGVNIEGSDGRVPDGPSSVSVAVHADSNGKPGAKLFDLVSPTEYAAGELSFFEAPPGTRLAPDASYVMVWRHLGGAWHRLQQTSSNGNDSGALAGFGIADAFYLGADVGSVSVDSGGNALEIAVYGEVSAEPPPFVAVGRPVARSWLHIPDDVEVGDQFRLVFVTSATDATSGDIEDYNAFVRELAAKEHNHPVIRRVASEFNAVVCTADDDARTNTAMTDPRGVPVHWLDGGWQDRPTLIADTYDDFYDGTWDNHEWGAYAHGNVTHFKLQTPFWTGCTADGVAHPMYHMGSAMGMVAVGTPRGRDLADIREAIGAGESPYVVAADPNFAPLGAVDADEGSVALTIVDDRRVSTDDDNKVRLRPALLYAISPIFTVVR